MKNRNFKNYKSAPNKSAPKKVPMKQDELKNKIYAWILLVAMVFWSIGSVLGIIAFASKKTANNGVIMASAEEVSTVADTEEVDYIQSALLSGFSFGVSRTNPPVTLLSSFKFRPIFDSTGVDTYEIVTSLVDGSTSTVLVPSSGAFDINMVVNYQAYIQDLTVTCRSVSYLVDIDSSVVFYKESVSLSLGRILLYTLYSSNNDSLLSLELDFSGYLGVLFPNSFVYCSFLGAAGRAGSTYTSILPYSVSYAASDEVTQAFNEGERKGYKNGYDDGYSYGYNYGESAGYDQGYKVGNMNGYDLGYAEGTANANDYTFTGLITSVVDVPIQAFTSLFNFELLGVNLASFFYALLTVAVILSVVKLLI